MENTFLCKVGYVVEDKEPLSKNIKVYLPEMLPFSTSPQDNTVKQVVSVEDKIRNMIITEKVDNSNVVVCKYIDGMTNRYGPPDIRQGEQVLVIQLHKTDTSYYWFPLGRDDNLRRLERFRLAVSDDTQKQKEMTDDNTYFFEMDTLHKQHIVVKTSKSNGEDYVYTFHIDAAANTVVLKDDSGNDILLDSNIPRIRATNRSGTYADLVDKDMILAAPRDIVMKANRQILINAPGITVDSKAGTTALKSNNITLDASNINFKAATLGIQAIVKLIGVLISGPITAAGYSTGSPGAPYPMGDVDLSEGSASTPSPEPASVDSSENRTGASAENLQAIVQLITVAFTQINAACGAPIPAINDDLIAQSIEAYMHLNKGE